ncbi:MAG: VOC family protein [Brevundimonas sp.]
MTARFVQTCHVLAVPDIKATAHYCVEALGFEELDIDAPGWRFVQRGPVRFDLGECPDALPARELGDHSWFARIFVEGIDTYHAEIAPRGALISAPPTTKPWGLREMVVKTPDGHGMVFCEVV